MTSSQEKLHTTADHPEPRHVTANRPEPHPILYVAPRSSRSVIRHFSVVSSVRDALLVSPKPTHSGLPVPELIPLSEVLPLMWTALWCVWTAYTTRESPEVEALASVACLGVTPRNALSACHVAIKEVLPPQEILWECSQTCLPRPSFQTCLHAQVSRPGPKPRFPDLPAMPRLPDLPAPPQLPPIPVSPWPPDQSGICP
ncbi:hypothetical protein E1301_Tti008608 [Triplophysa tibetana]|uniref:Uncharacterized protein n=1 Tax=Triplophysa tibetana TaxID=1572043 RepID=A0A5A9NWB4_9TELE|nr:hypothetical protein E1301_Tti008608 [Triplophysa tibetana]